MAQLQITQEKSGIEMNQFFADVQKFMTIAGQLDSDGFNTRQTALYIGLQLEEMKEKLEACGFHSASPAVSLLHDTSAGFKKGLFDVMVQRADKEKLLDADIDLAWVAIGGAFCQGANVEGAAAEVSRANLAKFPNGVAVRDDNGKVVKPEGWNEPDLKPFIYSVF
jgi:predicted HAD superfamily Cof-like phosphohydrolase